MTLRENSRQTSYSTFISPANNKYHGLLNQGATCYLNSVLQVLFMTKDFRDAVGRYTCKNPDTEYVDLHLKALFDDLKGHTAYTYDITKKLGIDRVHEQRDAAEYFEKILTLTSSEASQIFHGQLIHKTICSECKTEKTTDAPMWHLPLSLMDSCCKGYSVVDGIEDYFRDSHFSGLDRMYCDQCDAKVDVTVKCEVKHHPDVLVLLLKRFEFDYRYMRYVKNNRFVDVPHTLQIPKNQTYELYAIVDHVGDLRGGHYSAKIKSQDDNDERWYNFNDTSVTLLDYQPFQVDNTERSPTAYLLFYRKSKSQAADSCTEDTREVSNSGGFLSATSDTYDQIQDAEETGEIEKMEGKEFRKPELSPDLCSNVEDKGVYDRQNEPHKPQECGEKRNDLHSLAFQHLHEKQADEGKIIGEEEKDTKRFAEPNDQTEAGETKLEERVVYQDNDTIGLDHVRQQRTDNNHDFKTHLCGRHPTHEPLNKPDELSYAQRRIMAEETVKDGQTGGDEQSEKTLTENLNRIPEHQVSEGLENFRPNINEDQESKLEVGHYNDPNHVYAEKQGKEKKKRHDELASDSGHFFKKYSKWTEDNIKNKAEEEEKKKGEKRGQDKLSQKCTVKVHCDVHVEGQQNKRIDDRLEYVGVEHREEEIKVQIKDKHFNDGRDGSKQNKLKDDQEGKTAVSDTSNVVNSRHLADEQGEEKRDAKGESKDVLRRRTSGGFGGEAVEGHGDVSQNRAEEQMQQEISYKALGLKCASRKKQWPFKNSMNHKGKKKQKQSIGCFCFLSRKKNKKQLSESESQKHLKI